MGWLNDATSAISWLAGEATTQTSGLQPEQVQASFQQLGISSEDFVAWWEQQVRDVGARGPIPPGATEFGQWLLKPHGQQPQQQSAAQQQAQAQQLGGLKVPAGVDQATVQGVLKAAQELNIPPQLALAMAQQESGFDPNAVGDNGCSIGVMQLNICGGEGQGLPDYVLHDPYLNAKVSLQQVAQVMQQSPGASLGQIAAMAQRPADPAGYASSINSYIDSIQTGQGVMGWAQPAVSGSVTQRQTLAGGTSQVPLPFSSGYFQNVTQSFGANGEEGTDFGMPEHQAILTPVGGVITTRDDGNRNWGRAVYVRMPNGWTFFVGHLFDFTVQDGQTVAPGQVLGTSGGGADAPSPGQSRGPHVEIRFIDPSGQNQDPMEFLQPLFEPSGSGSSASNLFSTWMGGMFESSAQVTPTEGQQNIIQTPDHRSVDANSPQGQWYQAVDSVWTSVFGQHAPLSSALSFQAAGVNTHQGIVDAINGLPSGIVPGVSIGTFNSLDQAAQSQAMTSFGRSVPQSLIRQFFQEGVTTSSDLKLWFDSHSSSDIPPQEYQQVWDAANPYTQAVWNDVPSPTDVSSIWSQSGGQPQQQGTTPTSLMQGGGVI